jgi:hypothetical protein
MVVYVRYDVTLKLFCVEFNNFFAWVRSKRIDLQ